jgi:hypothetical protein
MYGGSIKFSNIKEYKFLKNKLLYIIKAKEKKIFPSKLKKINFFNLEKRLEKAIFYLNGTFYQKNIALNFKKGYFFDGKFYMNNCDLIYNNKKIRAKKAIYQKEYINFKKIDIVDKNILRRKLRYKILLPLD